MWPGPSAGKACSGNKRQLLPLSSPRFNQEGSLIMLHDFYQFLGMLMLICIALNIYARRWLKNNPDVKEAANDAVKAKAIELIRKYVK